MSLVACFVRRLQKRFIEHDHEIDVEKQPDILLNRHIPKEPKTAEHRRRQPPAARMFHNIVHNCGDRNSNEQGKKSSFRDMLSANIREIESGNAEKKRGGKQNARVKKKREKRSDNWPEKNADKRRFFVRLCPFGMKLRRVD